MTADERKKLAEQLLANPLTEEILQQIERAHIEALVHADTEQARIDAQTRVKAARSFRTDLLSAASTPKRKGAPV